MSDLDLPRVTVLLATYDGVRWLPEQLDTLLSQQGVRLELVVSDDGSTDGTWELLQERAAADPRVVLLPRTTPTGSAAGNFYRLLREVDLAGCDLVALADQDDVWLPGKLAAHAGMVRAGSDGVSSDVVAVHQDGRRALVRKSYPQRTWDWVFESPGPGCTFLLTPRLAAVVQGLLRDPASAASTLDFHDWLVYAVCRALGWRWTISDVPSVDYRQHDDNAFGAHQGARQRARRLALVRGHWHRRAAQQVVAVALEVAPVQDRAGLLHLQELLAGTGPRARAALVARSAHVRRRPRDRVALGLLVAAGVW